MEIVTIPCLEDNFAYLLICPETQQAAVVDPSEAAPVQKAIEQQGVELTTILNTHHHWDHVGGNKELKVKYPELIIYGHESDRGRIPEQTVFLKSGDEVRFGEQTGTFLHNPGHTSGAITFVFGKTAFTGDTLFAQVVDVFLKEHLSKCMIRLIFKSVDFRTILNCISDTNTLQPICVLL